MEAGQNRISTQVWDPVEYLQSEEDISAYLDAALEDGDATLIAAVLDDIARAKRLLETGARDRSNNRSIDK